jgi:hypothetical protein
VYKKPEVGKVKKAFLNFLEKSYKSATVKAYFRYDNTGTSNEIKVSSNHLTDHW